MSELTGKPGCFSQRSDQAGDALCLVQQGSQRLVELGASQLWYISLQRLLEIGAVEELGIFKARLQYCLVA